MNLKAIIAALIIGSTSIAASSAAMASPSVSVDARVGWTHDHRVETTPIVYSRPAPVETVAPMPQSYGWRILSAVTSVDRPVVVPVNSHVSQLELQRRSGKSEIQTVTIGYANGRTQTLRLDQLLFNDHPTIKIPLGGRRESEVAYVKISGKLESAQATFRVLAA